PQGPCTVYGRSWRTGPLQSALANGTMAHGFELDDVVLDSLTHLGAVTIPAALAVGEVAGATGARFLEGIVAGYEVGARVGRAVGPSHMLRGFHPTGTNGVFGAIGAAGKVLGLSAEELVQAFGIGASLASGVTAFAHDPQAGMVKRLHAGRAAEGGVLAVLLAKRGFTAPSRGIDGRLGYVESFSDQPDWEALTAGLGERFAISANLIKPYACCGILHPAVDAVRALKARHGISGDDVEHVRVGCPRKGCEQNTIPDPRDVMSAQYSMEFAVAAALAGDILDPNVFRAEAIGDPRVRGLLPRVEVALDEEMESLFPRKTGARVTVRLRDGREFTETVYDALGTPGNP
ncbi:MAG: MmgE/PrpD family protein, partial [Clostridia bacterium]|nr:MmgE/PrpD family protein [Clostridia bacterium]